MADEFDELLQLMNDQAKGNRYLARVHDYLARGIKQLPLFRLGLTGGFATGKSAAAACFEDLGCPIINADLIVHDLLAHDAATMSDIRFAFGDGIFQDGKIDRSKLALRVFCNAQDRKTLEAILHPRVGAVMQREAKRLEQDDINLACFEIPLLYETGWEDWCDSVVVVVCDEETQITRAMQKFSISRDEAIARIRAQMPLAEKKQRADVIIDNADPIDSLKPQVEAIYNRLLPQP